MQSSYATGTHKMSTKALRNLPRSVGIEGDAVDGTEMALDATKLLGVDHVVEASVEFTRLGGRHCDIARLLTTSKKDLKETVSSG